jgi:hypothetical protein
MRKLAALVLAALLAGGSPICVATVSAQETPPADALTAARELVAFMSPDMVRQMADAMEAQIWPPTESNLRQQIPSIDDAALAEIRTAISEETDKFFDQALPGLVEDTTQAYARHFSAAELREITVFYRTPTGGKLLRLIPQVTAEATANYMTQIPAFSANVGAVVQQILQTRGYLQ